MDLATVSQLRQGSMAHVSAVRAVDAVSVRGLELSTKLRAAVTDGDEKRIARLLSDLLRIKGLTKGQRIALQLRALLTMVHGMRSTAVNDEVTGLPNQRGFMQTATRLLDVAARDGQRAHLIYFSLGRDACSDDVAHGGGLLARQMGNFMRDLFPNYGVYDALGRLSSHEFVALTTNDEFSACSARELRARRFSHRSGDAPLLPLRVGIAHFDPARPLAIDELLRCAADAVSTPGMARIASTGLAPQPGLTLC
jgi:GGDEF domain-containing protein